MSADFYGAVLRFDNTDDLLIPKDLFGNHRITFSITLRCTGVDEVRPNIHPEAFRSSRNVLKSFMIESCDMSNLNFKFLVGFDQLVFLGITKCSNVHLTNFLPSLTSLAFLYIDESTWFDGPWITPTRPTNDLASLREISLIKSDLNDDKAAKILDWILASSLNGTRVEKLDLSGNQLTRIPITQINAFSQLKIFMMWNQKLPGLNVLSARSLFRIFPFVNYYLNLDLYHIISIEPDIIFNGIKILFECFAMLRYEHFLY